MRSFSNNRVVLPNKCAIVIYKYRSRRSGTVMKTESMEFTNTREGKWNYFTTTTGSMINAGKYTVRITAVDAEGVAVGGLDVQ